MADVQINLEIVTKAFEQALENSKKKTEEFSSQAAKGFTSVGSAFNVMAGNLAANAVGKALGFISDGFSNMIREAAESEKSVNELNIALKQAGLYTDDASERFQALADSISANSTVDDDLILKTQAVFLSLNNLSENGIGLATQRAVDLSAALGIDLSTATEMVSKAVNGSTAAFAKKGIVIEAGNTDEERLANLLKATAKFTGAAEAKTHTFTGAMEQQKNALGNLLAQFGSFITTNTDVIEGMKETTGLFQSLSQWLKDNSTEMDTFIKSLKISIPLIFGVGGVAWGASLGFGGLAAAATAAWAAITAPVTLVIAGIAAVTYTIYLLYKNWDKIKQAASDAWFAIKVGAIDATAAILEYSAIAVSLVSADKAQALRDQAQAYRDQAQAIRDAKLAAEDKALADQALAQKAADAAKAEQTAKEADNARAVEIEKQKQEMMQATEQLRADLRLVQEENKISDDANEMIRTNAKFAQLVEQLGREEAIHRQAQMNITTDKIEQEKLRLQTQIDANKKAIKDRQEKDKKEIDANKEKLDKQKEGQIEFKSWEEQTERERLATTKDTLGSISTLTRSSNNELFEIGKAAAIATATIDGYLAVQKAMTLPFPFNFAAAALVGAATAENIKGITNQQRPKFANGGIVPGSSFTGDRVAAQVNSGEMILNKTQQSKLFNQINNGSSNAETNQLLVQLIDVISNQSQSIVIDGREIISVVRDGLSSGRSIA